MSSNDNPPTKVEAQAALESLDSFEQRNQLYFRPPLWFNFIISLLMGIQVYCMVLNETGFNTIHVIGLSASFATVLLGVGWVYILRKRGIKPKIIPAQFSGKIVMIGLLANMVVTAGVGLVLYTAGFSWAPFAAAAIASAFWAYCMHKFPFL